jgi:hypothetical protein
MKGRFTFRLAAISTIGIFWSIALMGAGADAVPFEGEKTTWRDGFERFDFVMDEESLAIKPFHRVRTKSLCPILTVR